MRESEALYGRALWGGTTSAIQRDAAAQPHGYTMSALPSRGQRAEVGPPPPPCGLSVRYALLQGLECRDGVVTIETPRRGIRREQTKEEEGT